MDAWRAPATLHRASRRQTPFTFQEELISRPAAKPTYWSRVPRHILSYTRLRLGGRHPLWGMGVTSLMLVTAIPTACRDRIAASRPEPGPLTYTSARRIPCSMARRAAVSPARWAANAVPLRAPLKATVPPLPDAMTLPSGSVSVISVLLNVERM